MEICEILAFGNGYDGDVIYAEYDNSGVFEYQEKTQMLAVQPGQDCKLDMVALGAKKTFVVTPHKCKHDDKVYLIATTDGDAPARIDDRIRATNFKESPF